MRGGSTACGRSRTAGYATLVWAAVLGFTLFVPNTVVYAGIVEPLGLESLSELRGTLIRPGMLPNMATLDYHLTSVLPVTLAVLALSGVLGATTVRRTGSVGVAVAAAAVGPVLAAASYHLDRAQLTLWNEDAAVLAHLIAALAILLALLTATVARRSRRNRNVTLGIAGSP